MVKSDDFFTAVYRHSPIGLVILDQDAAVVDANDYMFRLFQVDRENYQGQQFGNLFNCSHVAGSQTVCGQGERCGFCHVRDAITRALVRGLPVEELEISNTHRVGGLDTPKWFKLSAGTGQTEAGSFAIVSFTDVTREKQYEDLLLHELTIDGATGALNKHSLIGLLQDLPGLQESYERISLGMVDLDDFKRVNDTYGHLMGDRVLESFTRIARDCVRRQDIIGRFGGEEFMLVFPGVDIRGAEAIIRRIHKALGREFSGIVEPLAFSAGFLELTRDDVASLSKDKIIERADALLYEAKRAGKRRFAAPGRMAELD